jgi:hypothetical protein
VRALAGDSDQSVGKAARGRLAKDPQPSGL